MAGTVECSYAESALLQEHSETLHSLASDLRKIASQLTGRAVELDDIAYGCRKRTFEESTGEPSSSAKVQTLASNHDKIESRIRQAAAAVEVARGVKEAATSIVREEHLTRMSDSSVDSVESAVSILTDRFAERLLQEHERRQTESLKRMSRHQKYIGVDGLPVYMNEDIYSQAKPAATRWPSVNQHQWGKTPSADLAISEASEAGLLQHITKDEGIQRSLILRAADRLSRDAATRR